MITKNLEDIKDTAIKLDEIRMQFPEDYFYLKGWIHCLLHKEERSNRQPRKPPKQTVKEISMNVDFTKELERVRKRVTDLECRVQGRPVINNCKISI